MVSRRRLSDADEDISVDDSSIDTGDAGIEFWALYVPTVELLRGSLWSSVIRIVSVTARATISSTWFRTVNITLS